MINLRLSDDIIQKYKNGSLSDDKKQLVELFLNKDKPKEKHATNRIDNSTANHSYVSKRKKKVAKIANYTEVVKQRIRNTLLNFPGSINKESAEQIKKSIDESYKRKQIVQYNKSVEKIMRHHSINDRNITSKHKKSIFFSKEPLFVKDERPSITSFTIPRHTGNLNTNNTNTSKKSNKHQTILHPTQNRDMYDLAGEYLSRGVEFGHGRKKSQEWNNNQAQELKQIISNLIKKKIDDPNTFDRQAMK